ncbi:hypothetical protein B0H17DRAFT_1146479 [Mycena rosella]|uniref:Uncharacterized protein n=1 Tax=Mycena rosella TaxID=1033263 RepID=A0AAD7CPN3_MYCRO|nr:hypothetical protein B0H17DRAFT_1146479 [Mycena rosella]
MECFRFSVTPLFALSNAGGMPLTLYEHYSPHREAFMSARELGVLGQTNLSESGALIIYRREGLRDWECPGLHALLMELHMQSDCVAPLKLGDSKIAALVSFKGISYYIITNDNYIPALPIHPEHSIFMRDNSIQQDVLPSQSNPPAVTDNNKSLSCMWWDVMCNDFICPESGRAIIRGLGTLRGSQVARLMQGVAGLIEQCGEYERSLQPPNKSSPLFALLINQLKLSQDRLQNLPATFDQMKLTVTQFQHQNADVPVEKCIGAFMSDAVVAQQFRRAGLPYWWLCETWQFTTANIWKVVEPIEPEIKTGTSTAQKIVAIRDRWHAIAWYHNSFDAEGLSAAGATNPLKAVERSAVAGTSNTGYDDDPCEPYSVGEDIDMMDEDFEEGELLAAAPSLEPPQFAGPSGYGSGECSQAVGPGSSRNPRCSELEPPQFAGPNGYGSRERSQAARRKWRGDGQKRGGAPQKGSRDKFDVFQAPEMPPSIEAWAVGLRAIDRSLKPTNKVIMQYVFPEPALIVSPANEAKRQLFLHHMSLLRPALFFRMGDDTASRQPLGSQAALYIHTRASVRPKQLARKLSMYRSSRALL